MVSRLDPAFGGLGVGAPGRFFEFLGWPRFFIEKTIFFFRFLYFGNAVVFFYPLGSFRINIKNRCFIMISAFIG